MSLHVLKFCPNLFVGHKLFFGVKFIPGIKLTQNNVV